MQGFKFVDTKNNSFLPRESDVGTSCPKPKVTIPRFECIFPKKNGSKGISDKTISLANGFPKSPIV